MATIEKNNLLKSLLSALLAVVLAVGMCLPAGALSPFSSVETAFARDWDHPPLITAGDYEVYSAVGLFEFVKNDSNAQHQIASGHLSVVVSGEVDDAYWIAFSDPTDEDSYYEVPAKIRDLGSGNMQVDFDFSSVVDGSDISFVIIDQQGMHVMNMKKVEESSEASAVEFTLMDSYQPDGYDFFFAIDSGDIYIDVPKSTYTVLMQYDCLMETGQPATYQINLSPDEEYWNDDGAGIISMPSSDETLSIMIGLTTAMYESNISISVIDSANDVLIATADVRRNAEPQVAPEPNIAFTIDVVKESSNGGRAEISDGDPNWDYGFTYPNLTEPKEMYVFVDGVFGSMDTYEIYGAESPYTMSVGHSAKAAGLGTHEIEVFFVDPDPDSNGWFSADVDGDGMPDPAGFNAMGIYSDIDAVLTVREVSADAPALKLVSPEEIQAGVSYSAFKIFDADVAGSYNDEELPKASNVFYAPGVTPELITGGVSTDADMSIAQNAAEFINENINHQPGVGLVESDYGMALARRLMEAGIEPTEVIADADAFTDLPGTGYYIIVRTEDLTGENTAASSPIYAALGAGETVIKLKTAIPEMKKEVQEDSTSEFGDEADHTLNQDVNYRIVGTVAQNIDAYSVYSYAIHDKWDAEKMVIDPESVRLVIDGVEYYDGMMYEHDGESLPVFELYDIAIDTSTPGKLDVTIGNLKSIQNMDDPLDAEGCPNMLDITADSNVVVTYTAHQIGGAHPEGVENTAYVVYSNNPLIEDSHGETPKDSTVDYSYALRIHKTDNATGEALAGVEFSLVNTDGKYLAVNADGELVESNVAYAFVTDENGDIFIDGADADTYTVAEVKTLDSYELITEEITVAVNAADRETVTSTIESVSGLVSAGAADDAVALVNVKNIKQIGLPSTGAMGLVALVLLAFVIAVIAIRRRNRVDEPQVMILQ